MIDLIAFEKWITQKTKGYQYIISSYEIRNDWRNRNSKPALEVILTTTDGWLGDVVFWDSGEADVYVLDNVAQMIFPTHYIKVLSPSEFDSAFQEFFEKLVARD